MRILVNGMSATGGGGAALFENFLAEAFCQSGRSDHYFVVSSKGTSLLNQVSPAITLLDFERRGRSLGTLLKFYVYDIHRITRAHNIDVILNFADIVLPVRTPQVYMFDWAYATYPDSPAWGRMTRAERLRRRAKLLAIRLTLRFATVTVAQTHVGADRLRSRYGLRHIVVIPSPVTSEVLAGPHAGPAKEPSIGGRRALLCLAHYAPHKNLEALIPLAKLLQSRRTDIAIVTTVDDQAGGGRRFLASVRREGLEDVIVNVGALPRARVPDAIRACDALLFPTLLESYGLPLVEAMFLGRTVITADFDFTREVCGDAAFYFNPLDHHDMFAAIELAFSDNVDRQRRISFGLARVQQIEKWSSVFGRYRKCLLAAIEIAQERLKGFESNEQLRK